MEKLKQGDYVKNLTKEQFEELVRIEGKENLTYSTSILGSDIFTPKSLIFSGKNLLHTEKRKAKTELTFEQFKQRLINTIQDAN